MVIYSFTKSFHLMDRHRFLPKTLKQKVRSPSFLWKSYQSLLSPCNGDTFLSGHVMGIRKFISQGIDIVSNLVPLNIQDKGEIKWKYLTICKELKLSFWGLMLKRLSYPSLGLEHAEFWHKHCSIWQIFIELMPFYFISCVVVYFICRPKARSASSIILRGANDFMLDEMERSMHDAICVVKRVLESKTVVPGGGAVEAALSIYLENFATSLASEIF